MTTLTVFKKDLSKPKENFLQSYHTRETQSPIAIAIFVTIKYGLLYNYRLKNLFSISRKDSQKIIQYINQNINTICGNFLNQRQEKYLSLHNVHVFLIYGIFDSKCAEYGM